MSLCKGPQIAVILYMNSQNALKSFQFLIENGACKRPSEFSQFCLQHIDEKAQSL